MEAPSPGRRRIVIRSVEGPNAGGGSLSASGFASGFSTSRMAISARADSEMPARTASAAKRSLSLGDGRAVIDGSGRVGRQATGRDRVDFGTQENVMDESCAARITPLLQKRKAEDSPVFQPNPCIFVVETSLDTDGQHVAEAACEHRDSGPTRACAACRWLRAALALHTARGTQLRLGALSTDKQLMKTASWRGATQTISAANADTPLSCPLKPISSPCMQRPLCKWRVGPVVTGLARFLQ